jgi:hypothetical protein
MGVHGKIIKDEMREEVKAAWEVGVLVSLGTNRRGGPSARGKLIRPHLIDQSDNPLV